MGISTQNIVAYLSTVQRSCWTNCWNCTNLLKKTLASGHDTHLSILSYRNTPLKEMSSPAQFLMNRRLRINLPTTHNQLRTQVTDHRRAVKVMGERKLKQKRYYDPSTRSLKPFHKDDSVRLVVSRDPLQDTDGVKYTSDHVRRLVFLLP